MKSPAIAFFLSFFTGLGHLYIGRYVRAFFYMGSSIATFLVFLFAATVLNGEEVALLIGALLIFVIWGINMLDMIMTIANKSNGMFQQQPQYQNINGQMVLINPEAVVDPLEQAQQEEKTKVLFMSLLPGVAHLYMGYTKRGMSIMFSIITLFLISIIIQSLIRLDVLTWFVILFIPVLIIYSIFDARHMIKCKQIDVLVEDNAIYDSLINRMLSEQTSNSALIFSLIPGFGHFALGYAKQGFQLLLVTVASFVLINDFNMYFLRYFTLLIWAYSFFDTLYILRNQQAKQKIEDSLLTAFLSYKKWIGLGLIVLGLYYGFDLFATNYLDNINMQWYKIYYQNKYMIISGIATFVLILVGIKLMTSSIATHAKQKDSKK